MHVRDRIARPNSPYCRLRIMFNSPANRMDLAAHSGSQFLPHPAPARFYLLCLASETFSDRQRLLAECLAQSRVSRVEAVRLDHPERDVFRRDQCAVRSSERVHTEPG